MARKWNGYLKRRARRGAFGYLLFGALVLHVVIMNTLMDGLPTRAWAIVLGAVVAFFGLAWVVLGVRYWAGYRHPIFQALGEKAESSVADVERELERAQVFGAWDGRVFLSENWLLSGGVLVRLADVLWFYGKHTRRSVNFVPIGTTRSLVIFTTPRSGQDIVPLTINAGDDADALFEALQTRAPWAFSGFREEWLHRWHRIAGEVAAKVAARRSASYRGED